MLVVSSGIRLIYYIILTEHEVDRIMPFTIIPTWELNSSFNPLNVRLENYGHGLHLKEESLCPQPIYLVKRQGTFVIFIHYQLWVANKYENIFWFYFEYWEEGY